MKPFRSLNFPRFLGATFLVAAVFSQLSCREWGRHTRTSFTIQERQMLDPAKTAEEWLERLEIDLKTKSHFSKLISNLYAELPPMDQWPAIRDALAKPANRGDDPNVSRKLQLLGALLREGDADVEPMIRTLITENEVSEYRREEALQAVLMVSKDRAATLEWLRKTNPGILEKRTSNHRSSAKDPADWQKALAENKVDEGIALLKAAIEQKADADNKASYYQRLIRLGLVLERKPLATEASEGLTQLLLTELKTEDRVSPYTYTLMFDVPALGNDWESIAGTFAEISTVLATKKHGSSSRRFGHMDKTHASYLTALYRLGRSEDFSEEMERAQRDAAGDPEEFFKLLAYSAAGQPPLGILYIDYLKTSGEDEKAVDYALHLLARNSGADAFYEAVIKLDKARAKTFIESLHAYDPFEERPLIWLAEIARRDGDLDLAQKTIAEAITLDPSDGDHGKDTRMFCYEVLARIHEDSGREEKAVFFRSVVDSIRQGEAADDFLHAGLIKEATDRYEKALGQFEDAYCLQSRLAMTLARNGRFDESVVHFKKAFELMPVSFGPRESHCFGCEGLFDDPRVMEIALPLLEKFEKENPDNARAPYLLGLILSEKNKSEQAALAFRRALELDPDYYNAARKLLKILDEDPENFTESETLRGKMFEIAPYGEKPEFIPGQANLRDHWKRAGNFPPSPLNLPAIPFASAPEPAAAKAQYVERDDYSYISRYRAEKTQGLDGWSPSELRRANTFLKTVQEID